MNARREKGKRLSCAICHAPFHAGKYTVIVPVCRMNGTHFTDYRVSSKYFIGFHEVFSFLYNISLLKLIRARVGGMTTAGY